MADNTKGIMALPASDQPQQDITLDQSYDAIRGGLHDASPQASMMVQNQLNEALPALDNLSEAQIDALIQVIQMLMDNEQRYPEIRDALIKSGAFTAEQLPEQYDPEVLATTGMLLMEAKRQRASGAPKEAPQGGIEPPKQFKKGGLAKAAKELAKAGRYGDTMLAHINKDEAALLKAHGGSGTINPETGLPEFWGIKIGPVGIGSDYGGVSVGNVSTGDIAGKVIDTAKNIVSTPIGKLVATAAIATFAAPTLGLAGSLALGSAGTTALAGGNIQDILKSGATAYLAATLSGPLGAQIGANVGVTSAAGQAALGAGAAATGISALTGTKLSDAVKQGLVTATLAGVTTGYQKGFDTPAGDIYSNNVVDKSSQVTVDPKTGQVTTGGAPTTVANQPATQFGSNPDLSSGANPKLLAEANQLLAESRGVPSQDPLGDFIQKNDAMRQMANTPAAPARQLPPPAGNILTDAWDKTKSLYNEYLSPSGIKQAGADAAANAYEQKYNELIAAGKSVDAAKAGATIAAQAATPGVISTYGPMVAAGLGITGLMGGYKPQQPAPSPLQQKLSGTPGEDLIRANPRQYIPQNIAGIQYDASGNIIGSQPWTPAPSGPVEVASNAMPYMTPSPGNQLQTGIPSYAIPSGAATNTGIAQVAQPYNTPAAYYDMMNRMRSQPPVRFAADGGFISSIADAVKGVTFSPQGGGATSGTASGGIGNLLGWASSGEAAPTQNPTDEERQKLMEIIKRLNLGQIRFAAEGGYMSSAFPMSPLTSDRGPLMAQVSSPVAMNTPGVPMNVPMQYAVGGIASLATGGYPRRTGQISGPGTETSDDIPAMLSDGEFVMTARAVRGAGGGDRRAGAKKMYALMHQLEKNAARG